MQLDVFVINFMLYSIPLVK